MQLVEKNFLIYKLLNSSFTGLSVGILFKIYEPLDPEVYSVGGMVLAVGMIVIAKFYEELLQDLYAR
jgi:putative membrane protein